MKKSHLKQRVACVVAALAIAAMGVTLAACSSEPAEEPVEEPAAEEVETPEDTLADEAAAAEEAAAAADAAKEEAPKDPESVSGVVTTKIDMSGYDKGQVVRVWVPVATDNDYQTITDDAIVAEGATRAEMTENADGDKMAYIEWDANTEPADRLASVSFHADRVKASVTEMNEEGEIPAEILDQYMGSSSMVKTTDPEIVALAEEITAGKETTVEKAYAVYEWIYLNMNRDDNVTGCGDGDVCRLVGESTRAGKCTDINSVFVALCRASGVPAREMFGVRMNDKDITKNQHCWCEFYVAGTGWVPADPADVLKAVLKDDLEKDSEKALEKKEYFWGQWDAQRVDYAHGRDVVLEPAQDGAPLNDFGYPYGEVDGVAVDFFTPDSFVYSISFAQDE